MVANAAKRSNVLDGVRHGGVSGRDPPNIARQLCLLGISKISNRFNSKLFVLQDCVVGIRDFVFGCWTFRKQRARLTPVYPYSIENSIV